MQTTVNLLRHGEPVGGKRYRGQRNDPLSEKGWQEMLAALPDSSPWQAIVSSPLHRCWDFASYLAKQHRLPLEQEPRLMEVGFGAWEGMTSQEIDHHYPGAIAAFYQDPTRYRPEGAESLTDFQSRVLTAWQQWIEYHNGEHTLMVAHAGVIRIIVAEILGIPLKSLYRLSVRSAAYLTVQDHPKRSWSLIC